MNLTKLFEIQKVLDERIIKAKGLEGQDLLPDKILALQVELGELANEWRGFKFWSKDREPKRIELQRCYFCDERGYSEDDHSPCEWCGGKGMFTRYPLLEEYVDCLHFILSIGLEINETPEIVPVIKYHKVFDNLVTTMHYASLMHEDNHFMDLFSCFVGLGKMLGLTWEQIEQAYMEKNQVNHERQANGY
jgi:dimeric dUTPase (all-alpha-NTP-PPase superfamily)